MHEQSKLRILSSARCASENNYCHQCAVRDRAFCSALDDTEIDDLSNISDRKLYRAGETIFAEADEVSSFANIIEGTVKQSKLMPDGRQLITGFLFPGDFVGKVYASKHSSFVEAVTDTYICTFAQGSLENLLDERPHLARRLFNLSNQSLEHAEEWMLLLGRKTAREKLASFILLLSKRADERGEDPDNIHLAMNRSDIADYLGLTIETVSRRFSELKSEQIIQLGAGNMVRLVDRGALNDLAANI
jgi:CRP/FNR family transcriptional regulator, anaerobic regulatory protein